MTSKLHSFLEHFRASHQKILIHLQNLKHLDDQSQQFFDYCKDTIEPFFSIEEQVLFSKISKKAEIKSGGPLCMLYYEQQQNSPPIVRAESICGRKIENPSVKTVAVEQREFFRMNSPVCIPITDHIACNSILKKASEILATPTTTATQRDLDLLATIYLDILKNNFEKKDNCLLPMCQNLLSADEMAKYQQELNLLLTKDLGGT